jgi:hypothetical protein
MFTVSGPPGTGTITWAGRGAAETEPGKRPISMASTAMTANDLRFENGLIFMVCSLIEQNSKTDFFLCFD